MRMPIPGGILLRVPKGLYKNGDGMEIINYTDGQTSILIEGVEHEISAVPTDENVGLYSLVPSNDGTLASSKISEKFLVKIIDMTSSKAEKSRVLLVGQNVVSSSRIAKSDGMPVPTKLTANFLEESDIE